MFNHVSVLEHIDTLGRLPPSSRPKCPVPSYPCLPASLPSTGFLQREAEQIAPQSVIKQRRRSPTPSDHDSLNHGALQEALSSPMTESLPSAPSSPIVSSPVNRLAVQNAKPKGAWKDPEPFEILRAVERKDIVYLMEIRDRSFHLLVQRAAGVPPLLHAMRIGKSHREVAIILVGAFSRYVNHLEDEDMGLPRTKAILKALRANLKLAIDYGLQSSQSDLIASFLQTLVMSEGDKWVAAQTSNTQLALRAGTAGQPVNTARAAVRRFATKELGKAQVIATLEDYVANATADLLMMGAWSAALDSIEGEPIPSYYFARDDRVYKTFVERLDQHQSVLQRSIGRRLKWQMRVLRKTLEGRSMAWHSKVDHLAEELDQGKGV